MKPWSNQILGDLACVFLLLLMVYDNRLNHIEKSKS